MRVRLRVGTAVSEAGLTSVVTSLPGVNRVALSRRCLFIDYRCDDLRHADIVAALDARLGQSWRPEAHGRLRHRWDQLAAWLVALAEPVQALAVAPYPVGFRERLHEAYLNRYKFRRHGLRTDRRGNWRHYMNRPTDAPGAEGPQEAPHG